ncbi:hypothetical protein SABIM44S_01204 [Streptomyces abikoensis]
MPASAVCLGAAEAGEKGPGLRSGDAPVGAGRAGYHTSPGRQSHASSPSKSSAALSGRT